jgi:hypothetical protein
MVQIVLSSVNYPPSFPTRGRGGKFTPFLPPPMIPLPNMSGTYTIKHYGLVIYLFLSKLMCLSKPVEVTDYSSKTLAYNGLCTFTTVSYRSIMIYSIGPT